MTARRAVPERLPARRLPCWHKIPYPAQRFLDLWGRPTEVYCLFCGKFQPVIVTRVTEDVALVTRDML